MKVILWHLLTKRQGSGEMIVLESASGSDAHTWRHYKDSNSFMPKCTGMMMVMMMMVQMMQSSALTADK